ncbi:MAG: ribokinase [Bacteroidales bacterium]|nr:ribokinase [Bacteroidales bacterium]
MEKKKILVIGSSNTDMVIKTSRFPKPGETILGGDFFMNQGGKGANQAVAVARLHGDVDFICKTGNDLFREQSVTLFRNEGINTEWILSDNVNPSGVALIMVGDSGENSIVVASGANGSLSPEDIEKVADIILRSDYILMQLEIPVDTVDYVVKLASSKNKKVILNPAPAVDLPQHLLEKLFLITPNRIEAELLSGIKIKDKGTTREAAKILLDKGVEHVIITMGEEGALVFDKDFEWIPGENVEAADTTGAGDVFNGALTVGLAEGLSMSDAVRFANRAAAISITRFGAIQSIPHRKELLK